MSKGFSYEEFLGDAPPVKSAGKGASYEDFMGLDKPAVSQVVSDKSISAGLGKFAVDIFSGVVEGGKDILATYGQVRANILGDPERAKRYGEIREKETEGFSGVKEFGRAVGRGLPFAAVGGPVTGAIVSGAGSEALKPTKEGTIRSKTGDIVVGGTIGAVTGGVVKGSTTGAYFAGKIIKPKTNIKDVKQISVVTEALRAKKNAAYEVTESLDANLQNAAKRRLFKSVSEDLRGDFVVKTPKTIPASSAVNLTGFSKRSGQPAGETTKVISSLKGLSDSKREAVKASHRATSQLAKDLKKPDFSFSDLEAYRTNLLTIGQTKPSNATGIGGKDKFTAEEIIEKIDDFYNEISPKDLIAKEGFDVTKAAEIGKHLNVARAANTTYKKVDTLGSIIAKAEGNPQKIKQGIKQLLNNPKKSRGFSKADRELLDNIVKGGPGSGIADFLTSFTIGEKNLLVFLAAARGSASKPAIGLVTTATAASTTRNALLRNKFGEAIDILANVPQKDLPKVINKLPKKAQGHLLSKILTIGFTQQGEQ